MIKVDNVAGRERLDLTDLSDSLITGVIDKQLLQYDSSSGQWINVGGSGNTIDLGGADLTTTGHFYADRFRSPLEASAFIDWNAQGHLFMQAAGIELSVFSGEIDMQANVDMNSNAILGGGAGHDQFSDFVTGEHTDHALNIDADLIVWLRMDDVDGSGVPQDLGSEGMTWIKNNQAAQTDDGVIGKAFTFDGIGDSLNVASPSGLPTGNSARTLVARVKTSSATTQVIIGYGQEGSGNKLNLAILNTGAIFSGVSGGNIYGTRTDLGDGQWHTVAVSFASGDAIEDGVFHVDGVPEPVNSFTTEPMNTLEAELYIGIVIDGSGAPFNGNIDDVRIYGRKLTDAEHLEIHQLGTLDTMTTFTTAYFKEYIASRSGFFSRLNVIRDLDVGGSGRFGSLEVEGLADPLVIFDQNTDQGAFTDYQGVSGGTTVHTISTIGTQVSSDTTDVQAPDAANWQCQNMIKIQVNGTDHWIPAYTPVK